MDVKRWQLKGFIPGVEGESKAVLKPWVVLANDFDRVTAERDSLQQRLNAVEEENDRLNTLVGEKRSKIRELIADQDKLRVKIMRIEHNSPALKILKSLPSELLSLSGCENTAGVSACIEFIQQEIIALENRS